jgi:hypothetical protein
VHHVFKADLHEAIGTLVKPEQRRQNILLHAYVKIFASSVDIFAKRVVQGVHLEQVMKLGFATLAKKVSLTWISKLTKDESH